MDYIVNYKHANMELRELVKGGQVQFYNHAELFYHFDLISLTGKFSDEFVQEFLSWCSNTITGSDDAYAMTAGYGFAAIHSESEAMLFRLQWQP